MSQHSERANPAGREEPAGGERGAFGVEQHLIARCEVHVPSAGFEARLPCVLPFLQQSASLGSYAAATASPPLASCAVPEVGGASGRRGCWPRSAKRGEAASLMGELHQRGELRPVVLPVIDEGAQDVCNDTVDPLDLARGVVVLK